MDKITKELITCLQWYVDEDDVIEHMIGNEYWVAGKRRAETILAVCRIEGILDKLKET